MKIRLLALFTLLIACSPAYAQWDICLPPHRPLLTGSPSDQFAVQMYNTEMQAYTACLNRQSNANAAKNQPYNPLISPAAPSDSGDLNWQPATNIGESRTGDASITFCRYETLGGFKFGMNVTNFGICPFSVKVNPATNQIKF